MQQARSYDDRPAAAAVSSAAPVSPPRIDNARVLAALAMPVCVFDRDGVLQGCNDHALCLIGVPLPAAPTAGPWYLPAADDLAFAQPLVATMLAGGAAVSAKEVGFERVDGGHVRVLLDARLLRDDAGEPDGVVLMLREVTTERELTAGLRESREVLATIVEATPECIKVVAPDATLLSMNAAGLRMIGAPNGQSVHRTSVAELIAPEFRDDWLARHARVCAGERLSWEFDIIGLNGVRRHMETHAAPMRLADGNVAQLAVTRDVSERKRQDARRALLLNELNHRVKNTLATVQAIAAFSSTRAASLGEFRERFDARLLALSRAHDVLTQSRWTSARLSELLRQEGAPHGDDTRIAFSGHDVELSPRVALAMAMVFHELATNAAKYGALSVSGGTVHVHASLAVDTVGARSLSLLWREAGGPTVAVPSRRGFGTRLIDRTATGELDGRATLSFDASGLRCALSFPLPAPEEPADG